MVTLIMIQVMIQVMTLMVTVYQMILIQMTTTTEYLIGKIVSLKILMKVVI